MKATSTKIRSRNGRRQPSRLLAALAIALADTAASGVALAHHASGTGAGSATVPAGSHATTLADTVQSDCARCTLDAPVTVPA